MSKTIREYPAVQLTKWAKSLMKNKLVITVVMLIQGISFLLFHAGNVTGTIRLAAGILIAAAVINIVLHLLSRNKSFPDYLLVLMNLILVIMGILCFVHADVVEPYLRVLLGAVTILTNLLNLLEALRMEERGTWKRWLGMVVSFLMIVLGLVMCFLSAEAVGKMMISVGGFLVVNALVNLWYLIRLYFSSKKEN